MRRKRGCEMHAHEDTAVSCCSSCCSSCAESEDCAAEDAKRRRNTILLTVAGVLTAIAIVLHLLTPQSPIGEIGAMISASVASIAGLFMIFPALKSAVLKRSIDIHILMAIAVIGAWVLGEYVEAAAVIFFFCIGERLEDYAVSRNRSSIERLLDLTSQTVHLIQGDRQIDAAVEEVSVGSRILIRPGERIALDGTVSAGGASVDESPVTGESVPVFKQTGDPVYAGSLSVDGKLEITTTATVENSTLARIVELVEESQKKRTPYERFINRFARYYTPLVVVVALLVALVPTLLTALTPLTLGGIEVWGYRALSLLVIACPCALVIATPVSVVAGLTRAARTGILVKGGAFLELGAKVKAVAFDKTGTLTYGRPEVVAVEVLPGAESLTSKQACTLDDVLVLAAALERDSTHPLARAIVEAAGDVADLPTVEALNESAGQGVSAVISGRAVALGSPAFINVVAASDERMRRRIAELESQANTVLVLSIDAHPVALFSLRDSVREQSPLLIGQLGGMRGIHTVMLTGDNPATAAVIAEKTGVDETYAGLLPGEKMQRIEELKRGYATVAMVGDGINDAPALAAADVGIAMGGAASDTAVQVADVVLMADNIAELPAFFKLSRRVVRTIRTNIIFALTVKIAVMVFAALGIAEMWMAIMADVGVLLLVLLYSLRLNLFAPRKA
ncbi:MAG TPA: heavy metal translocating P-type ATPase [Coriobacteriia bacterium]|nr:heavy metal translocating P-type ATPase [Coriobacteriia bacterium]